MKNNKVLIGVLIISFLVTAFTLVGRITVESQNRSVDVVLDYYEFDALAETSDEPLVWWFEKFKNMGVQYVALREETIESLMQEGKPLDVEMVENIVTEGNWQDKYPKVLVDYLDTPGEDREFDLLVKTDNQDVYEFIKERMINRYEETQFTLIEGDGLYFIVLKGTIEEALYTQEKNTDRLGRVFLSSQRLVSSKLTGLGLGLDPVKIKQIQDSGLKVMPRPYQYEGWESKKQILATFNEYLDYNIQPPVMIFDGENVLGYPEFSHITQKYMKENNIKVGLIERSVQREYIKQGGIDELIKYLNYNATGVFSVPEFIQLRYAFYHYTGAEEIENTLYRAVTERNMRLIYFRPFKINKFEYVTNIVEYEKMFNRFETRLAKHGMVLGESSSIPPMKVRRRSQMVMGWGVVAAGILMLNSLVKIKEKYNLMLLAMGAALVMAILYVKPNIGGNLLTIMAAIIFGSLGMIYFVKTSSRYFYGEHENHSFIKKIRRSIIDLLVASGISFVGAIYVAAILADVEYFIAMNVYRGVKVSQLVPIVVFIIAYLSYFGYKRKQKDVKAGLRANDIKELLMEDIKVIYVLLGGIVLAIGYIYIARTGHGTDLQASNIEMLIRNTLGDLLLARPRTKEFLIAFPILLMGFYVAQKKYKILIFATGLMAVMGQTSIINTFSHFRTPVYLSIVRTTYSLGLGIVIGVIYIVLLEVGINLLGRMKKQFNL